MPELPDIELYVERIAERIVGPRLEALAIFNPFVLRSVSPTPTSLVGLKVVGVSRLGKRVVLEFENDMFAVLHLMISGRFTWQTPLPPFKRAVGKIFLASFRFENGSLTLQESSTKKRASITLVAGREGLEVHRRPGIDVFSATSQEFRASLQARNRTLKRALTDPNSFDGIGNAYSDEILFHARLSPIRLTNALSEVECTRLHEATKSTFNHWRARLKETSKGFPKPADVTAFRPDFAVHGKFNQPCPDCGAPVQRIVYAENETNYCARCQNEGRLLADRSLSRLLKSDWPKTLDELVAE